MDDVVGVKEVQASGDVRQDPGAVFVPPKVALVVVAQSILEVPACTRLGLSRLHNLPGRPDLQAMKCGAHVSMSACACPAGRREAQGDRCGLGSHGAGGSPSQSSITSIRLLSETQAPRNWTRFLRESTVSGTVLDLPSGSWALLSRQSARTGDCCHWCKIKCAEALPVKVQMPEQCNFLQQLTQAHQD